MNQFELSSKSLSKLLDYDEESGAFYWKPRNASLPDSKRFNSRHAGKRAGYTKKQRSGGAYEIIRINGVTYFSHHLAWLYKYGSFPGGVIDHIDGNGANNAISNLRDVSQKDNNRNKRRSKANTSGVNGVSWNDNGSNWKTYICVDNKTIHLGFFNDLEEAKSARLEADRQYGFHTNHGR